MKAAVIRGSSQPLVIEELRGGGRTEGVTHRRQLEQASESFKKIKEREMDADSSTSVDLNPIVDARCGDCGEGFVEPANYPRDLERDVVSDGSTRYHLRPIRPDDGAMLIAFHRHLAPRSIYLRFFTFHPTLTEAEVQRFTCVDYVNRLALVAEIEGRLIAVARFDSKPGDVEAEVAFVVADEYQHHGIGSLMLDELARAARRRGITTFRADTLAENHTMLDVFRHAGFSISSSIDFGTVTLRFPIEPTETYQAALAARESKRHLEPVAGTSGFESEVRQI
jgi:GNAT superfamily N-acetyltransferase